MGKSYYIGLDIHKTIISYCIKTVECKRPVAEGKLVANREVVLDFFKTLAAPFIIAMEATMFTGWVYDLLKPLAEDIKVAHPEMLKAITVSKKKNDRLDAEKICDLLRYKMLPECYMAPVEQRNLRRILRYRNMIVREAVRMKNKVAGLLMEVGVEYTKKRLHGQKYFEELLQQIQDVPDSVIELLQLSRHNLELFQKIQKKLIKSLREHDDLRQRVERLMTIPGIGEVTALTWVLEIGDVFRFPSIDNAISYAGLCSAEVESGGKRYRRPISKKRNKHLQKVLIEAAKLAPRFNEELARIHAVEVGRGHRNRATLEVARRLVAYLMAVDKRGTDFEPHGAYRS
jgi:transposase